MADERWASFSDVELRELYTNLQSADEQGDFDLSEMLFQEVVTEMGRRGLMHHPTDKEER